MDIFSRIETQQPDNSVVGGTVIGDIVEIDGKYGYKFVVDDTKRYASCEFSYDIQRCNKTGFFVEKRTEKLYKILLKPRKEFASVKKYEQWKAKRDKKIQKLLKKGVNFEKYFSIGMGRAILEKAPEEDIRLLYSHGFDIRLMLSYVHETQKVFSKDIYFGISEFDTYILRNIPTETLEKIIHTRGGLKISDETISSFIGNYYYNTASRSIRNIQLLIKTGQIYLTPEQIVGFCDFLEKEGCTPIPEVALLKQIAEPKVPRNPDRDTSKKYTTQRRIETKKEKPKSEAQEAIDKLFEDAQKSTE